MIRDDVAIGLRHLASLLRPGLFSILYFLYENHFPLDNPPPRWTLGPRPKGTTPGREPETLSWRILIPWGYIAFWTPKPLKVAYPANNVPPPRIVMSSNVFMKRMESPSPGSYPSVLWQSAIHSK